MPTHFWPAKAKDCGCTGDDITFVSLVDFNAPGCRSSANVEALCERVATINDLAPERNCALCILPDVARDSSLRGLYDEEKNIQEGFFALRQHCDTRFIELFPGWCFFHKNILSAGEKPFLQGSIMLTLVS